LRSFFLVSSLSDKYLFIFIMMYKRVWVAALVVVTVLLLLFLLALAVYLYGFYHYTSGRCTPCTSLSTAVCFVPLRRHTVRMPAYTSRYGLYNPTVVRNAEAGTFWVGFRSCTAHTGNSYLDFALSGKTYDNRFRVCEAASPFDVHASHDDEARLTWHDGGERTIEDIRLFECNGDVWGVGCVALQERGLFSYPVLLRFQPVGTTLRLVYCDMFRGSHDTRVAHKNWIGFAGDRQQHGGAMLLHHDTYPEFRVSRIDAPGRANRIVPLVVIQTQRVFAPLTNTDVRCVRGTSNWIEWDDSTWAFVAHTKVTAGMVPLYRSSLVLVCRRTMVIVAFTPWLNLDAANENGHGGVPIQFASALWRDAHTVSIGMGLNDAATCFQSFHARDFERLLRGRRSESPR
jgi:hypothetical protein